jgi:hypothetical protein
VIQDLVFILIHIGPIDSADALKTHTERSVCLKLQEEGGGEGIVANSPLTIKKLSAYRPGSCGAFPGYGQLSTLRHFFFWTHR